MTEVLVSVRIPSRLVEKLKAAASAKHFLDLSEVVRSIIRQRWYRDKQPILYELNRIRDELKEEIWRLKPMIQEGKP